MIIMSDHTWVYIVVLLLTAVDSRTRCPCPLETVNSRSCSEHRRALVTSKCWHSSRKRKWYAPVWADLTCDPIAKYDDREPSQNSSLYCVGHTVDKTKKNQNISMKRCSECWTWNGDTMNTGPKTKALDDFLVGKMVNSLPTTKWASLCSILIRPKVAYKSSKPSCDQIKPAHWADIFAFALQTIALLQPAMVGRNTILARSSKLYQMSSSMKQNEQNKLN